MKMGTVRILMKKISRIQSSCIISRGEFGVQNPYLGFKSQIRVLQNPYLGFFVPNACTKYYPLGHKCVFWMAEMCVLKNPNTGFVKPTLRPAKTHIWDKSSRIIHNLKSYFVHLKPVYGFSKPKSGLF